MFFFFFLFYIIVDLTLLRNRNIQRDEIFDRIMLSLMFEKKKKNSRTISIEKKKKKPYTTRHFFRISAEVLSAIRIVRTEVPTVR